MPSALLVIAGFALGVATTVACYHGFSAPYVFGRRIIKATRGNVYLAHCKVAKIEEDLQAMWAGLTKGV